MNQVKLKKLNENFQILNKFETLVNESLLNEKSVIYFTSDIPIEVISAFDLNPFRLPAFISIENNSKRDTSLIQPFICSKVRNELNLLLNPDIKANTFIFSENYCDSLQNLCDIFTLADQSFTQNRIFRFLLPSKHGGEKEKKYYRKECLRLITWLEGITGKKLEVSDLKRSIEEYNTKRKLLFEIYSFLNTRNLIYDQFLSLKIYVDILPIQTAIGILEDFLKIIKENENSKSGANPNSKDRLLLLGSMFDHPILLRKIFPLNSQIVSDNLSFGLKSFDYEIPLEESKDGKMEIEQIIDKLAQTYIVTKASDAAHHDPKRKLLRLSNLITKYSVNKVIYLYYNFCDPDGFESRIFSKYLKELGISTLVIHTDPQLSNIEQLTTRIEAFIES